jgi:hypothetical protein
MVAEKEAEYDADAGACEASANGARVPTADGRERASLTAGIRLRAARKPLVHALPLVSRAGSGPPKPGS